MAIFIRNMPPVRGRIKVRSTVLGPAWLTSSSLTAINEGTSFSINLETEYQEPVRYSVVDAGNKPVSWTVNATTGKLMGIAPEVPRDGTVYAFTVRAEGVNNGKFTDRTFSLPVNNVNKLPVFTTSGSLGNLLVGRTTAYSIQIAATDPDGIITGYQRVNGAFPDGLTFNPTTGLLSGNLDERVIEDKSTSFTLRAVDDDGADVVRTFDARIIARPQWVTSNLLGSVNETNSITVALKANHSSSVTYALVAPVSGVSINANTGSTTLVAPSVDKVTTTVRFTVRATSSFGTFADRTFEVDVLNVNQPPRFVAAGDLGGMVSGNPTPYTFTLTALDNDGTIVRYELVGGALPAGFTLNATTGAVSGLAAAVTQDVSHSFVIRATDDEGASVDRTFTLATYSPPQWTNNSVLGSVNELSDVTFNMMATATSAVTYSVVSGSFPAGFTINSASGVIRGTAPSVGKLGQTYSFRLRATNARGVSSERDFQFTVVNVNTAPTFTTSNSLGTVTGGSTQNYVFAIAAVDDSSVNSVELVSGELPGGLSYSNGAIRGTLNGDVNADRVYTFTLRATDDEGAVSDKEFSINAIAGPVWQTSTLRDISEYAAVYQQFQVKFFAGSVVYSVVSGSLPAGLTLAASTGIVTGTPTDIANSATGFKDVPFTLRGTASNGATVDRAFVWRVLNVNAKPTWNTATNLGAASADQTNDFVANLSASDSDGTIMGYYLESGSLPTGFTLSSTGVFQGKPPIDIAGKVVSKFSVSALDNDGSKSIKEFTFTSYPSASYLFSQFNSVVSEVSNASRTGTAEMLYEVSEVPAQHAKGEFTASATDASGATPVTASVDSSSRGTASVNSVDPTLWASLVSNSTRTEQVEMQDEVNGNVPTTYNRISWTSASSDAAGATPSMAGVDSAAQSAPNVIAVDPSVWTSMVSNASRVAQVEMQDEVNGNVPAGYAVATRTATASDAAGATPSNASVDDRAVGAANTNSVDPTLWISAVSNVARPAQTEMPDEVNGNVPSAFGKTTWNTQAADAAGATPTTADVNSDNPASANIASVEPTLWSTTTSNMTTRPAQAEVNS